MGYNKFDLTRTKVVAMLHSNEFNHGDGAIALEALLSWMDGLKPEWHKWSEELPPMNTEIIAYNHLWKDEDFNPYGIRIGFAEGIDGENIDFMSCIWDNEMDSYESYSLDSGEDMEEWYGPVLPEYWREIPKFRKN